MLRRLILTALTAVLSGCYYFQAATGHLSLLAKREPIAELLEDPGLDPVLRQRLTLVADAREFAVHDLALPDNGSYDSYVELDREFVVWNVFAAPEFSLKPHEWCFPIAGCVHYRGHFRRERAENEARRLQRQSFDVRVAGVPAYSTLGRFRDPVLSTMFGRGDDALVATLFHELAHQQLYVAGDTTFNESFATAVANAGLERWLESRGTPERYKSYRDEHELTRSFVALADGVRDELRRLYASGLAADDKRSAKAGVFDGLAERYRELAADAGISRYPKPPSNNADLVPLASYNELVPAFETLLAICAGDFDAFYRAAERYAEIESREARRTRLERLVRPADPPFAETARTDCSGPSA